jgi:hypothetical protein
LAFTDWGVLHSLFIQNEELISIALPFGVVLFFIYYFELINIDISGLVASLGVVIAILFFALSTSRNDLAVYSEITSLNSYNCGVIKSLEGIVTSGNYKTLSENYLITDLYEANLGYIYIRGGLQVGSLYSQEIHDMEYANKLLDLMNNLNVPNLYPTQTGQLIVRYNQQLFALLRSIDTSFCSQQSQDSPSNYSRIF